jgi:hypothetical protein
MQSWSLHKFVNEYGAAGAAAVWGKSRQAVEKAVINRRDIQIIKVNGLYEVRESKLLNAIEIDKVQL